MKLKLWSLRINENWGSQHLVLSNNIPEFPRSGRFIEGWYLSYFTPDAARSLPLAGPQKHLNVHGDNLGNVVQFMEREYPKDFQKILNRIAEKIPGVEKIRTERTPDGRLLDLFQRPGVSRIRSMHNRCRMGR